MGRIETGAMGNHGNPVWEGGTVTLRGSKEDLLLFIYVNVHTCTVYLC